MMRGTGYALAEIFGWMVAALGMGFLIGWISGGWRGRRLAAQWESFARNELRERLAMAARSESATDENPSPIEIYIDDADDREESSESGPDNEVTTLVIEPSHEMIVPDQSDEIPDSDERTEPIPEFENLEPEGDPRVEPPDPMPSDPGLEGASEQDPITGPADPFEPDLEPDS